MSSPHKTAGRTDAFKLTLLIFAVIAFMYFTGEVLKPLALAVLLSFALAPAVRLLERAGLPRVAAVVLTVVLTLGVLGGIGYRRRAAVDLAGQTPARLPGEHRDEAQPGVQPGTGVGGGPAEETWPTR